MVEWFIYVFTITPPHSLARENYTSTHTRRAAVLKMQWSGHKLLMHCKGMYCDIVAHSVVYAASDKPHTQRLSDLW